MSPTAVDRCHRLFVDIPDAYPGCSAALAIDGKVVFRAAYGAARLDPLTPLTPDTAVEIASTTKQFTATAILMLEDRGLLESGHRLSQYLGRLPDWADAVTVGHALKHTSGIPDYLHPLVESGIAFTDVATGHDTLRYLASVAELRFEPGTSFEYSNSNYVLLGLVVAEVTGRPLADFVEHEILGALELAGVMTRPDHSTTAAQSYCETANGWASVVHPWTQVGDGGMQTTPTDLVRFADEYWRPTLVSAEIAERRFLDPAVAGGAGRYGYGMYERWVDGRRTLRHAGEWESFVTSFVVVPALRAAACVVSCTFDSPIVDFDNEIGDRLVGAWLGTSAARGEEP